MVGISGRDGKAQGITTVDCTALSTQGLEKMIDLGGVPHAASCGFSFERAMADTQAGENYGHEVRPGADLGWSMLGQDSTSMA